MSSWPPSLFAAPILRGLDAAGRQALEGAGRLRSFTAGERVFAADELGDSFFVIERGEVELRARTRASFDAPVRLRVARAGETFGEEATLPGGRRRAEAVATSTVELAEIPAPLFARALGRSGAALDDAPEHRALRRQATADLLRQISLAEELPPADFEVLLDAAEHRELRRGARVYTAGDPSEGLYLIAHGLVQLQREAEISGAGSVGGVAVRAYLSDGDFFGDAELLDARPRELTAVTAGETHLLFVATAAFRNLVDRNPGLVARLRRIAEQRDQTQAAAVEASPHATRHVFADLYRMQMARSLLTIDQDACVRCGHCAWSCEEVHGVARLVRRGDKVVTSLRVLDGPAAGPTPAAPRELLLPNSCQHCKNPVCMIDCPTGAIGRDPEGEVFIRESLCTGCGNCAKACPWENIRMAPRPLPAKLDEASAGEHFAPSLIAAAARKSVGLAQMFPEVATKCDLCRDYEAPACVQACPTEAIIRLEPERDFAEVAAILGHSGDAPGAPRGWPQRLRAALGRSAVGLAAALGLALVVAGLELGPTLSAATGPGLAAGIAAALAMLALVAHALPKRRVKRWMKPRARARAGARALVEGGQERPVARSRLRPFYLAHLGLGLALPGLILLHAGPRIPANAAGTLTLLSWLTLGLGLFGALGYALIPRRLTRLEHGGALPEDLADERERLLDRLQRELSGKSAALKQLCAKQLLPWARAPLGALALLLSGRELGAERVRLRARVEGWLPPELRADSPTPQARAEALAGLEPLLRTCVELRALPLRRVLSFMLRAWLGPHVLLTGALLVNLLAHVLLVTVLAR